MAESSVPMFISFVAGWRFIQVSETLENVDNNNMHVRFKCKQRSSLISGILRGMSLTLKFLSQLYVKRFLTY